MSTQQLSAQSSQRTFISPKLGIHTGNASSLKFGSGAPHVDAAPSAFDGMGLTPKQQSKVLMKAAQRKTESKLRASQLSTQNAETTTCSQNQIAPAEASQSALFPR